MGRRRAFICGLSGLLLTPAEREFLDRTRPAGIILFARNIDCPAQVKQLVADAKEATQAEGDFLVLVDQEGGRVQRLRHPHWRTYPPAEAFARAFPGDLPRAARSAYLVARLMAEELAELGMNVDCAPVLDIPLPQADRVIGDRAYGADAATVTELAREAARGLLDGGVLPVIKHIPGHGRAMADSHLTLPVIDAALEELQATDFAPFAALADLPIAMTAHVVLCCLDAAAPVTVSRTAIETAVRGLIGFDGLLISDDLSMRALSGDMAARTVAACAAGCDIVLHCNGDMGEMEAVASTAPELAGKANERFEAALSRLGPPRPFEKEAAEAARADILAMV